MESSGGFLFDVSRSDSAWTDPLWLASWIGFDRADACDVELSNQKQTARSKRTRRIDRAVIGRFGKSDRCEEAAPGGQPIESAFDSMIHQNVGHTTRAITDTGVN